MMTVPIRRAPIVDFKGLLHCDSAFGVELVFVGNF
jgi:hypothetical protein